MNPLLLLLLAPPILVVLLTKLRGHDRITAKEMLVQGFVACLVIIAVWSVSRYSSMRDTEFLNGQVVGKEQDRVSCEHSYQCNCRTVTSGSGNNQTTSTVCDTCYDHPYDYDWNVSTTVGDFTVDRVDRQGVDEPTRWSIVQNGQPVALPHNYTNYIRAAPDSLFHGSAALIGKYKGNLPGYPQHYDYQYADRVIASGVQVPNLGLWNERLAMMLRAIGPEKQANVIVVMTNQAPSFADALRQEWLGGKKNDIVVVVGTKAYPDIAWVRVFSWAKQDIVNVMLRNDLVDSKTLDPQRTVDIVGRDVLTYYARRPMAEFKYLAENATPPTWVIILALLLGTGVSVYLGFYFYHNDPFDNRPSRRFTTMSRYPGINRFR